MCRFKSGIILKDRVFVPDYDSHTDMLAELGIEDTEKNAKTKFIRAELYPENGDVFTPIDRWKFKTDQDILPDWYIEEIDKGRMIDAVKTWAKNRIHIGTDNLVIESGGGYCVKDCKNVVISGSATVKYIYGSATVENISGNATVENISGNATVENIYGSATVKYICDSATVKNISGSATVENISGNATVKYIYGSATVKYICDSATVKYIYGNTTLISSLTIPWKNKNKMNVSGNATFKDSFDKVIYQAGEWTFKGLGG